MHFAKTPSGKGFHLLLPTGWRHFCLPLGLKEADSSAESHWCSPESPQNTGHSQPFDFLISQAIDGARTEEKLLEGLH